MVLRFHFSRLYVRQHDDYHGHKTNQSEKDNIAKNGTPIIFIKFVKLMHVALQAR